jgi:hypothetical protein
MTKKRKLVVLAVGAVGLVAGSLLYLKSLPQTPLRAGYERIRVGMTAKEVHAVMEEAGPFYPNIWGASPRNPDWLEFYISANEEDVADVREVADVRIVGERVASKHFRYQKSKTANKLEEVREWLGL